MGELSQCAYAGVKAFFQATLRKKQAIPGVIVAIQTFGDLVTFHPHLHAVVSDALFVPNDWLSIVLTIDRKKIEELFRHPVLKMLVSASPSRRCALIQRAKASSTAPR